MEKLSKYKTQIFNIITIFLILEFAIYPGLTTANTFLNILAGIGLLLLIVWGGIALYQYATSNEGGLVDMNELKEAEEMLKKSDDEFEQKDEFQIRAGIKGDFYKNKNIPTELVKEIADSWREKLSDEDPLISIPMSRVSKEAKQKIAEIAKQDITKQLEQDAEKFAALFPNDVESNSKMPDEIKKAMMEAPIVNPKPKTNRKKKSEYPLPPHSTTVNKSKTKKTK